MKLISRLIMIFFIFNLFGNIVYAQEDSTIGNQEFQTLKSYGIVDDSLYNNKNVNRADCVISIMKVIGMTPEIEKKYRNALYYTPIFHDVDGGEPISSKYFRNGYLLAAGSSSIAIGDMDSNFIIYSDVKVKEVTAFMIRCITSADYEKNLDDTFKLAKDLGLIKTSDTFYNDGNATLTPNEFCVILNRMLYQKRYMYYDYKTFQVQFDTTGSGKYIDYLKKMEQ